MNVVEPPIEYLDLPWHQLRNQHVIERMRWYSHQDAIAAGVVASTVPDQGGWWIRFGTPLTAQTMHTAGWTYLGPCAIVAQT